MTPAHVPPAAKEHLAVLDGLRGTAALSVVIFHFQELSSGLADPDGMWLRHAYLAVDFFFCLSGYVIGYAYDDRRDRMGVLGFFRARLIRLHPLVVFGLVLGLVAYAFDPFNPPAAGVQTARWLQVQDVPAWTLVLCTLGGLLMIPTPALPNRFGSYVSLNAPAWSLMWEYVANIAFALVLWRMRTRVLMVVVALAAVGVAVSAYTAGNLALGFAWGQMWHALVRTMFSFCMGLLLFRCGVAIRSSFGFASLSVLMVVLLLMPVGELKWMYELVVVLVVFPLIVAVGAGAAQPSGALGSVCRFSGRVSYPVYILHYGFIMVFANYHWTRGIDGGALPWVIAGLTLVVVLFSHAVLILYDEPVRAWLSRTWQGPRRSEVSVAAPALVRETP